ncbi:MAG: hypothetical protein MJZ25_14420 [Fibrobacter sp.]|nr:hypothetical protein [Fibrobacter sp.]
MEGLLILIGVYVLEVIIKKVAAGKKEKEALPPQQRQSQSSQESSGRPGNLQDLIRQFDEAQRQASQGTLTPETPPVEDFDEDYEDDEEEVELPTVTPANPNRITFKEIAESVIQWEEVSVDYLQQAFGFSESTAQQVLAELQAHHIAGRDMGEGFCDLLVHDKSELDNLFKREQREAEERRDAEAQEEALRARHEAELKHQKELAELEERARQLREQAVQGTLPDASEGIEGPCLASSDHKTHRRTFDKAEIRRGFVWAKVLDEPRFKKRWSSRVR